MRWQLKKRDKGMRETLYTLTKRENEVYQLLLKGLNITEIAEKLDLSYTTVHTYRTFIYQKKGVSTIQQLLAQRIKELEQAV